MNYVIENLVPSPRTRTQEGVRSLTRSVACSPECRCLQMYQPTATAQNRRMKPAIGPT